MKNKHILYIILFLNSVIATKAQSGNEANNSEAACINPPAVSLNPSTICSGKSSLITAIPTNGGITPFYTWKLNNVILPLFTNKTTLNGLGDNNVHRVFRITNNIYAATDIGLSISTNSGNTFSNKTKLANGLGNDVVLGVFVSSTKIYAATAAGLSISSDGGTTFINKTTTDGLGSNIINDVFVDATGNTIYAATASGLSVSTNAGLSFVNKSMSNVRGIFVNGNNIYAATSTGLNISTDGGINFILKTTANGLGNNNVNDVFKVGSIIHAATSGGLSISTDGGINFSNKTTVNGLGDNNVSSVYAIGSFIYASTVGGLSMSNDGGNTFFINKTATDGLGTNTVNDTFAEENYIYTASTGGLAIASINTYQVNNVQNNDVYSVTMLPSAEVCPSPNPVTTNLTISPLTALTINSNSPVCSPSTLTLTASGCAGTVTWSQGAATGTSLTISAVGTYSITAICSVGGCSSNANTPVLVEIKAKPIPPTIISPQNLIVCSPTTLTLSASGCAGNITWSQGGVSGTILTLSAVGTYSISANCSVNSCISDESSPVFLEIKAKPSPPTITPPTSLSVCSPTTLTLTASACVGTVTWSQGAATGTSLTISAVGTYAISANCSVNSCTSDESSPVFLEIKAKPNPPTITPPTSLSVCSPTTLTLTASACAGIITWSQGAATGTSLTISAVGTYAISANCSVNSCTSDASSPVICTINSLPIPTTSSNSPLCAANTLSLTASGGVSYAWSGANGFTSTMQNPSISSITTLNSGTYVVTATDVNGCTATATTSVIINPLPMPTASSNSPVCNGLTLNLSANGGSRTPPVSYAWSGPNSFSSSLQNPSILTATTANSGIYSITVTDINSCTATTTTSATVFILPNAHISSNTPLCAGATLNLTAENGGAIYSWSGPNSFASTIQNSSIPITTLANAGVYSITITYTSGCTATATTSVVINPLAVNATNTGPYQTKQAIQLVGTGGSIYSWAGPNGFTATGAIVNRTFITLNMAGIYTATITNGPCSNTATTNVVITGIDPCEQIMEYTYLKAGNPYQAMYSLQNGMVINQEAFPTSILVHPICNSIVLESVEMNIQGPNGLNWNIIQNVEPFALFDNAASNIFGRILVTGNYTLAVTGYSLDNKGGVVSYPTKNITFTVVGNSATINMPIYTKSEFCAGNSVDVTFTTTGSFNAENQFKIQLSDGNGDFTNAVDIGTSPTASTVTCTIPLNTLQGENYRIRVLSTNAITQNMNPSAIVIHPYILNQVGSTNDYSIDKTQKAVYQINATNKINSPAKVIYQAGNAITLNAGFEAKTGTVFKAEIKGCNN